MINVETNKVIIQIKEKLDEINPMLQLDGGGVEYIDYQDNILFVRMGGHCVECMGQEETMNALLRHIQEDIPEVKKIINVPV